MKRCVSTLLAVVLIAALAFGGSALARTAAKSSVTIASGNGTEFTGRVASPKKACRAMRTVQLFRADGSTGPGTMVGSAKTNSAGAWTLDGNFIAGYYYARVQKKVVHLEKMVFECRVDVSVRRHF